MADEYIRERLTRSNLNVNPDTDKFLHAAIGGKEIDWKQSRDSTLNVLLNGPTSNGFCKDIFRKMARDLYGRLKAYEDTGLPPKDIKDALPESAVIKMAAQALRTEPGRLRELVKADELVREMEWRSDKYINYTETREKACKGCTSRVGADGCDSMEPCEDLIAEIICAPAADVAPVVHGQWIGEGDGYADGAMAYDVWHCSVCDYCIDDGTDDPEDLPKYCQNCGAKMDGGADERAAI